MGQGKKNFTPPSLHIRPIVMPAFMAVQAATGSQG